MTRASAIKVGDGLTPSVQTGPPTSPKRLEGIEGIVAGAIGAGSRVASGAKRAGGFNAGPLREPTARTDVTHDMGVLARVNVGPATAITRFLDDDEVLARADALDLGLSACALARSPRRARRTVAELEAGMVAVSGFAMAAGAPFGGTGFSGLRREGGPEGLDAYLDTKLAQVV